MLNSYNFSGHSPLTSYVKMYAPQLIRTKNLNFEGDELTVVDCSTNLVFRQISDVTNVTDAWESAPGHS